jgi:hypothetical protein
MAIQTINVGSSPNDGNGDSLRTAFIISNNNFAYLASITGSNSNITANTLTINGNIYLGQSLNYVAAGANLQVAGTANSFVQIAIQNKSTGTAASTDIAAVADNGNDSSGYIDMGITSSTYNQSAYNVYGPNDGYLIAAGNTTTGGGNLILNTYNTKDIVFVTAGTTTANEQGRFKNNVGLIIKTNVATTSSTSGALQVQGGVGVTGDMQLAGNISTGGTGTFTGNLTAGNLSGTDVTGTLITAAQPNITSIGNLTANLSMSSGFWIQSNTPGTGNINIRDAYKIIRSVANSFNSNITATDTVVMDIGNAYPQLTAIGVNVNVTWSYSSTITPGYIRYLALQNISGATRQVVLPNSNNNKGANTVIIANGITASFTFTAFDSTSANVVVFIANN